MTERGEVAITIMAWGSRKLSAVVAGHTMLVAEEKIGNSTPLWTLYVG
jgi:hypothetical protein